MTVSIVPGSLKACPVNPPAAAPVAIAATSETLDNLGFAEPSSKHEEQVQGLAFRNYESPLLSNFVKR